MSRDYRKRAGRSGGTAAGARLRRRDRAEGTPADAVRTSRDAAAAVHAGRSRGIDCDRTAGRRGKAESGSARVAAAAGDPAVAREGNPDVAVRAEGAADRTGERRRDAGRQGADAVRREASETSIARKVPEAQTGVVRTAASPLSAGGSGSDPHDGRADAGTARRGEGSRRAKARGLRAEDERGSAGSGRVQGGDAAFSDNEARRESPVRMGSAAGVAAAVGEGVLAADALKRSGIARGRAGTSSDLVRAAGKGAAGGSAGAGFEGGAADAARGGHAGAGESGAAAAVGRGAGSASSAAAAAAASSARRKPRVGFRAAAARTAIAASAIAGSAVRSGSGAFPHEGESDASADSLGAARSATKRAARFGFRAKGAAGSPDAGAVSFVGGPRRKTPRAAAPAHGTARRGRAGTAKLKAQARKANKRRRRSARLAKRAGAAARGAAAAAGRGAVSAVRRAAVAVGSGIEVLAAAMSSAIAGIGAAAAPLLVACGVVIAVAGTALAAASAFNTAGLTEDEALIATEMRELGYGNEAIAGVLGNAACEGLSDPADDHIGLYGENVCGIWQFSGFGGGGEYGRLHDFAAGEGRDWRDPDVQTDFLFGAGDAIHRSWSTGLMDNGYYSNAPGYAGWSGYRTPEELEQADDVDEAAYTFMACYERCGNGESSHLDRRLAAARSYYEVLCSAEGDGGHGYASDATSEEQRAVVDACYSTPSAGANRCAAWVSDVYRNAGLGWYGGNACDMYANWCHSSDLAQLKPGMMIAVGTNPRGGAAGVVYGHVGIYIGDGIVMENIGYVAQTPLEDWLAWYQDACAARWGYPW